MMIVRSSWIDVFWAAVVLAIGAGAPSLGAAQTNVLWRLADVTLSDGGTLSGDFNVDPYGYVNEVDLTSTSGSVLAGDVYTQAGNSIENSASALTIHYGTSYSNTLDLVFDEALTTAAAHNAIVSGYECFGSQQCPTSGENRYVTGGFAAAPEPAAWSMMLLGAASVGGAVRRSRRGEARPQA